MQSCFFCFEICLLKTQKMQPENQDDLPDNMLNYPRTPQNLLLLLKLTSLHIKNNGGGGGDLGGDVSQGRYR